MESEHPEIVEVCQELDKQDAISERTKKLRGLLAGIALASGVAAIISAKSGLARLALSQVGFLLFAVLVFLFSKTLVRWHLEKEPKE